MLLQKLAVSRPAPVQRCGLRNKLSHLFPIYCGGQGIPVASNPLLNRIASGCILMKIGYSLQLECGGDNLWQGLYASRSAPRAILSTKIQPAAKRWQQGLGERNSFLKQKMSIPKGARRDRTLAGRKVQFPGPANIWPRSSRKPGNEWFRCLNRSVAKHRSTQC